MVIKVGDGFPLDLIKDRIREYEYLLRDEFLTPRLAGAVNGTAAEPGPGTRFVTDTESKLSIAEGRLAFGGGKAAPSNGDPGFWSQASFARQAGLLVVGQMRYNLGTDTMWFGWDNNKSSSNTEGMKIENPTGLKWMLTGVAQDFIYTLTPGETYALATLLRANGNFNFVKHSGQWNLLYISKTDNYDPVFAAIPARVSFSSWDFLRVPAVFWLPRPLASDGFATPPTIRDQGGISDGTASNVGLGGAVNGAHFGGDSYIDIYSADLNTRFDGAEGTILCRAKINQPEWVNGTQEALARIWADGNNQLSVYKNSSANQLNPVYVAGTVVKSIIVNTAGNLNYFTIGMTWDKTGDEVKDYYNGANSTTLNGLGIWAGNLAANACLMGGRNTAVLDFKGFLSDAILGYGIVATAAQMATLHSLLDAGTLTTSDLDAVFGAGNWSWWKLDERYETDGNGHAEGPNPDDVGGGGAGRAWTNRTFAISAAGGTFQNNLLGQADLVTNGDFTNWTGGDPDDWTVTESLPNTEVSETGGGGHGTGGNGHCNLYRNGAGSGTDPRIRQAILTVAAWYKVLVDIDTVVNGGLTVKDSGGNLSANFSAAATDNLVTGVVTGTNLDIVTTADPTDITLDNVRVQQLLLNELMALQDYSTEDVLATVTITARLANTQAGLATNVDDPDNPQSFLLLYYNSKNDHVVLDKYVSGTRTNLLDVAAAYSATGELRIVKNGTSVRVYYNDTYIGNATVSDPEIINNTYHGLFSTDPANTLDNFYIYASNGKNGEYDILDEF